MASSFRDGRVLVDFGQPGPPSGNPPTTSMQVPVDLGLLLTGADVCMYVCYCILHMCRTQDVRT